MCGIRLDLLWINHEYHPLASDRGDQAWLARFLHSIGSKGKVRSELMRFGRRERSYTNI